MNRFIYYFAIYFFCPISLLSAFGAESQIKPGNLVHITVLGYPEMSKVVLVRQDGTTDYPLLANIPIDGMTVHSLHELLQPILVRFIERPKLFINIAEYRQIGVTVEGQIANPGTHIVKEPISLQGILAIAGGTKREADLRNITISRRTLDSYHEITIDLYKFFSDRDQAALPDIKDGDIIFVPLISHESSVRVIGAVRAPGLFIPVKDENIADMINRAGGPMLGGKMNSVIYMEFMEGKHTVKRIKLKWLIKEGLINQIPLVYPGDIIVVNETQWYQDFSVYIDILRNATYVISSLIILQRL